MRIFKKKHKNSLAYEKIYPPIYNSQTRLTSQQPDIYNRYGEKLNTFFLRDAHSAHSPYSNSRYIFFDRFNIGLDTHFYTHKSMLETMGSPTKKYGWLTESATIVPEDYRIFERHKGLHKEFESIFTYSEKILEKYENAKFLPSCAGVWYGTPEHGGTMSEDGYTRKTKNISILSSHKAMCELHILRLSLARQLKTSPLVDTFGTFDGGPLVKVGDTLSSYRYSIVIENDISPYFFTERITNCFAAMTVPIYIGTPNIGNFFNAEGIIALAPQDGLNIETIIRGCTEKDYEQRLPFIIDNYKRVQKYINMLDYMYKEYLQHP